MLKTTSHKLVNIMFSCQHAQRNVCFLVRGVLYTCTLVQSFVKSVNHVDGMAYQLGVITLPWSHVYLLAFTSVLVLCIYNVCY